MSFSKFPFFLAASIIIHVMLFLFSINLVAPKKIFASGYEHSIAVKMVSQVVQSKAVSNQVGTKLVQTKSGHGTPEVADKSVASTSGNPVGTVHLPVSYPEVSRRRGEEGVVQLRVVVDQLRRVEDVVVLKSSGFQRLDLEAIRAARSLEGVEPGPRDFSVQFKLDDL